MRPETHTDNNGTPARSESESATDSLISPSLSLLKRRHFSACRDSAHSLPRSDPTVSLQLDRILAVAEVLAATSRRPLNWYSILGLRPGDAADRDLVRQQFKTLVRLLDPNKNKLPFADEALMRVREAWFVLSDPARKERFDSEIREATATATATATASFWTMCPYCWYLHEYEKKYEDCTLRCSNCKKTFHGAAVRPPSPESLVAGKEEYYCYHVSLPLRYPVGEQCRFGVNGESVGRKRLRIKTVANRVRMKRFVEANGDEDSEAEEENEVGFG